MKLEKLACPSCGAPITGDFAPNQQIECNSCGVPLMLTQVETESPIFCPGCRTLNSDEVRFCTHCGNRLKTECILCHEENRIDTTYCAKCGVHIEHARAKRRRLQETRQRLEREREEKFREKEARQKQERLEMLLAELDEPENHDFAIYRINQMGADAVDGLIETMLNDHDPDARYGSARALGQICVEQEIRTLNKARTVKGLIKALEDREPAVRYWAAEALGKYGSKLAIEPLAGLLKDPHEGVRGQALSSLHEIGGDQVQQLIEANRAKGFLGWLK